MQEQQIDDSVLEKIQKLANLINDKAATQGEVENATRMMNALLLKHNLEISQITAHNEKGKNPITEGHLDFTHLVKKTEAGWISKLLNSISYFNMCKALSIGDKGIFVLIGTKANMTVVIYIVGILIDKIRRLEISTYKEYCQRYDMMGIEPPEKRNTFRRGYYLGFIAGISRKLREQKEEMEAQQRQQESDSFAAMFNAGRQLNSGENPYAVMLRNNDKALMDYINDTQGKIKTKKATQLRKSHESRQLGFRAGTQHEFNKGLDNNSNHKIQ